MKKIVRNKDLGITLIALVITIIVLLILAGISISMLSGDNSILQKATDAKTNTEKATVVELAQADILGKIAENKGDTISETQLRAILSKYFEEFDDELPEDLSDTTITLTSKNEYGSYSDIALLEIYNGSIKKAEKIKTTLDLREGDIVRYNSSIGNIDCVVLYDSTEDDYLEAGVQMVSAQTLGENIELGNGSGTESGSWDNNLFNISKNSYNNAITTLNNIAETFRKNDNAEITISARCLGTNPNASANSRFQYSASINTITNKDFSKIQDLSLNNITEKYWLAHQYLYMPMNQQYWGVCLVDNGEIKPNHLYGYSDVSYGDIISWSHSCQIRPVFKLKNDAKIKSGTGVSDNPYIMEL